jgi:hypothetical protein
MNEVRFLPSGAAYTIKKNKFYIDLESNVNPWEQFKADCPIADALAILKGGESIEYPAKITMMLSKARFNKINKKKLLLI